MSIPLSWYPVDISTDFQRARAHQTLPLAQYKKPDEFLRKLKKHKYQNVSNVLPVQLTPNSTIVCSIKQPYAVINIMRSLSFCYIALQHMVYISRDEGCFYLYNNCVQICQLPAIYNYFTSWISYQERKGQPLLDKHNPEQDTKHLLDYRELEATLLWKVVGPKTICKEEETLTNRRIELRL